MAVKKPQSLPEISRGSLDLGALFASGLLYWNEHDNDRAMPWKGEKDPYRIWLSEIILQQTRVEQGLKYYQNFISTFPDITALAAAPDEAVFKLWEGLGYYSRCRNLLSTARVIAGERGGVFPNTYHDIVSLKGVGRYTAAAIASFAYNLPYAVLDGNVFRVLSRIFAIDTPTDSTEGKKAFAALSQAILPKDEAGAYNQAIMDFGATVCKPAPRCDDCFFNQHCRAFRSGLQDVLPVKEKKMLTRERWFYYLVIRHGSEVLIRQRTTKDIWQQLFEFFLLETEQRGSEGVAFEAFEQQYGIGLKAASLPYAERQKLTHQTVNFIITEAIMTEKKAIPGYQWAPPETLTQLAFPKTLQQYLRAFPPR